MRPILLLLPLLVCLSSCGSGPNAYYTLSADGPIPSSGGMGIGVGPVTVAEYMDRPNLVVAETDHRLGIAENHRWAGDLSAGISRVMAANLGRRWRSGHVSTYPWRSEDGMSRQVTIDIRQMHGEADGHAVLEAGWRVYALPERRLRASGTFVDREPLQDDGYDALVAAQSRLLSRLAERVAEAR